MLGFCRLPLNFNLCENKIGNAFLGYPRVGLNNILNRATAALVVYNCNCTNGGRSKSPIVFKLKAIKS